ncbi:MAG: tRNA-intron lyase [Candidatus Marsarchaeota archaeon]|jgi:tRNA-intron endonuclease|nr:tRNA-intron lyase [Candidatus Marsarchaeota archaeon]
MEINYVSKNRINVTDQSSRDILARGHFGTDEKGTLKLEIEEALYLMDLRNAVCRSKDKEISFNELSSKFWKSEKFMARYFTYRDWRDRGLIIKNTDINYTEPNKTPIKQYPGSNISLPKFTLNGIFFKTDLISIVDDKEKGKELYDKLWFGQYGSYKASERGQLNKLDIYETIFLSEKGILNIQNISIKDLVTYASSRRKDFQKLYEVYRDWREKGFVIKTGFKFGTHFRVYFPGAKPSQNDGKEWTHSKHVIHVFPKESRLLISEWARAIRVAHSVRKTFILAVPGSSSTKKADIDFILYHRRGGEAENPTKDPPRYAMLSLSEEEYIGGKDLAAAIRQAKSSKLELILAIADRETSVTYYKVLQIQLPGSKEEYYEIDWFQP